MQAKEPQDRVLEPPFGRATVVANPISGRGQGLRAAREVREGLRRKGVDAELFETTHRGAAYAHLRSRGQDLDLVVAVGGDGTLREVLEGLVEPATPVALLPYGTANVLAHELGLPRDVHHALEIVLRRRTRLLDVAKVNAHLSFLVLGVGFDAMTVRELERRRRGPIRRWSYVCAVLRTLSAYRPPRLRVTVDGKALDDEHGLVLVSNTRGYAGVLRLDGTSRLDDGRFEVILAPARSRAALVSIFARGLVRDLARLSGLRALKARHVRIESEEAVPYQIDGDLGGETPVELEVSANQYRILVP